MAVNRRGEYRKLEFTFDKACQTYTIWEGGSDTPNLNAALLPKGVMATVVDDGELVIFVPISGAMKKVQDRGITTTMSLQNWGDKVIHLKDGDVWQVRTT